jgi:hypothetical protein
MYPPSGANSPSRKVNNQLTGSYFSLTLHGKGNNPASRYRG